MLKIDLRGRTATNMDSLVRPNRRPERKLADLGGRKILYSHTYHTEQQFWKIYSQERSRYAVLRERYRATSLSTVHDKVRIDGDKLRPENMGWLGRLLGSWPVAGAVGILHAITGKH